MMTMMLNVRRQRQRRLFLSSLFIFFFIGPGCFLFCMAATPDIIVRIGPSAESESYTLTGDDPIELMAKRAQFGSKETLVDGNLVLSPDNDVYLCEHFYTHMDVDADGNVNLATLPPVIPYEEGSNTVMLVPRGECSFESKAYAASAIYGASAIFIYDRLAARYRWNETTDRVIYPRPELDYECGNGYTTMYNLPLDPPRYKESLLDPYMGMTAALPTSKINDGDNATQEAFFDVNSGEFSFIDGVTVESDAALQASIADLVPCNLTGTTLESCDSNLCLVTNRVDDFDVNMTSEFRVCCAWDTPVTMPAADDMKEFDTSNIIAAWLTIRDSDAIFNNSVSSDLFEYGATVSIENRGSGSAFNATYIFMWMWGTLVMTIAGWYAAGFYRNFNAQLIEYKASKELLQEEEGQQQQQQKQRGQQDDDNDNAEDGIMKSKKKKGRNRNSKRGSSTSTVDLEMGGGSTDDFRDEIIEDDEETTPKKKKIKKKKKKKVEVLSSDQEEDDESEEKETSTTKKKKKKKKGNASSSSNEDEDKEDDESEEKETTTTKKKKKKGNASSSSNEDEDEGKDDDDDSSVKKKKKTKKKKGATKKKKKKQEEEEEEPESDSLNSIPPKKKNGDDKDDNEIFISITFNRKKKTKQEKEPESWSLHSIPPKEKDDQGGEGGGTTSVIPERSSGGGGVEMNYIHVIAMCVSASLALILLYFFKVLYNILFALYGLGCARSVSLLVFAPIVDKLAEKLGQAWMDDLKKPLCCGMDGYGVTYHFVPIIWAIIWIWFGITHFMPQSNAFFWLTLNIFGACACVHGVSVLRLNDIKIAIILLVGIFFYDVFFVYITPFITGGTSVMLDVVVGSENPSGDDHCYKYPDDCTGIAFLPMIFILPQVNDYTNATIVLGLGDIVLPGFLICFCSRLDEASRLVGRHWPNLNIDVPSKWYNGYFFGIMCAYSIGLLLAFLFVLILKQGQPALLYICPSLLIAILFMGRKNLKELWNGPKVFRMADQLMTKTEKKWGKERMKRMVEEKRRENAADGDVPPPSYSSSVKRSKKLSSSLSSSPLELDLPSVEGATTATKEEGTTSTSAGSKKDSPRPVSKDVCIGYEGHPGTRAFRDVVQEVVAQNCDDDDDEQEYSPEIFKQIKKKLKGRRFFFNTGESSWTEATKVEIRKEIGKAYDQARGTVSSVLDDSEEGGSSESFDPSSLPNV